ncbi:hypothetical protein H6P81_020292 [Aristolochia fimbriata]|uniref:Uncharacterized protein n=1 Tax=Aristolochia fimbriata TaxID=158543 RepID=A0AAV7DYA3_ARIFI|nr:hypothetical protein H6P81_020292 [Aristolochia fimbriata]
MASPDLLFAQDTFLYLRWPGGVCSKDQCCFPSSWTVKDDFLVQYLATTGLPPCNNTPNFNPSQLQPILTDLNEYWPSLSCPSNSMADWENTWNDNGICTGFSQHDYFTNALALRTSAHLLNVLSNKGIEPSRYMSYKATEVVSAINEGLGGVQTAVLHCGSNSSSILRDLRLCADSTASTFITCSDPRPNTCSDTITLLPLASTTVEDEVDDSLEAGDIIKMVVS